MGPSFVNLVFLKWKLSAVVHLFVDFPNDKENLLFECFDLLHVLLFFFFVPNLNQTLENTDFHFIVGKSVVLFLFEKRKERL